MLKITAAAAPTAINIRQYILEMTAGLAVMAEEANQMDLCEALRGVEAVAASWRLRLAE